jgi:predicted butyrate kinase (DUF1464 family)
MRVIGIDPGTVTFDVCGLQDGAVFLDLSIPSTELGTGPAALVEPLVAAHRLHPLDLVLGPSGYGLPLLPAAQVGEAEIAQMLLVRADEGAETVGIGGMKSLIRALIGAGLPLVFAPGAIHLPTIPAYRKANRIDMGTADKVCSAALAIYDQATRLGLAYRETSFIMLELGGAFTAALVVEHGKVADGMGGSSGPLGLRAAGALDADVAYMLGASLSKDTVFSGGALDIAGPGAKDVDELISNPRYRDGWLALIESAAKAVLSLTAVAPRPREVLLSGRLAGIPAVEAELAAALARVAPVRPVQGLVAQAKSAAQGAALLADGLAGGQFAPLVEAMELRGASGTALDYLKVKGADKVRPDAPLRAGS